MNKTKTYRALRVDMKHLDAIQNNAEDAINLAGYGALRRTDSPALPGGQAGALSGFAGTYDAGTDTLVLAGTAGALRSLAVTRDGALIEMAADSDPLDVSTFSAGSDPFVVWGQPLILPTNDVNVVVFAPGVGEQVQLKKFTDADALTLGVYDPAAPPLEADGWFPLVECTGWSAGSPVLRLCGPLRDLTAHSTALDTSKPQTLVDALLQAAVAFDEEHYLPGHDQAGKHKGVHAGLVALTDALGGDVWAMVPFFGSLLINGPDAALAGDFIVALNNVVNLRMDHHGDLKMLGEPQYLSRKTFTESSPVPTWQHETYGKGATELWAFEGSQLCWRAGSAVILHGKLFIPLRLPATHQLREVQVYYEATLSGADCTLTVEIWRHQLVGVSAKVAVTEVEAVTLAAGVHSGWLVRTPAAYPVGAVGDDYYAVVSIVGAYDILRLQGAKFTFDALYVRP